VPCVLAAIGTSTGSANVTTELHLENTLAAAASCRAGQDAARVAASTRAGQGRARAAAPFRAREGAARAAHRAVQAQVQPRTPHNENLLISIPRRVNPQPLFLSHSLYRATPKAMRGVFFLSFLALSFPHSNHRATRYVIREFVCTPSLSLSLSRTLFRATSIAMRGVGDFPHIETPFPPVPYALRALAAIETSTGSGLRPRRPTLSLSCTCRTPSRQRR